MTQWTSLYAPLIGRILIGGFFLWSGIQKILNLSSFITYLSGSGFPQPMYVALGIVTILILCSLALIVDVQTRFVSTALALYMLATSFAFFSVSSTLETQLFLENMAIVGGLLMIAGFGTSRWSPAWQK